MSDLVQVILGLLIMLGTMAVIFSIRVGVETVRRNRQ